MSKTRLIHHIVFGTRHRAMTISESAKKELYAYIFGMLQERQCHLIRMNGMPDHIHILVDINPSVSVAGLVQEIKQSSSKWMKSNPKFPNFRGWCDGYYAVSVGVNDIPSVKEYIINQEIHHTVRSFVDELKAIAGSNNLTWHEMDLG